MTGKDGGWTDADEEVMRYERERAPSPAMELVRELRDALAFAHDYFRMRVGESNNRITSALIRADKALAGAASEPQGEGAAKMVHGQRHAYVRGALAYCFIPDRAHIKEAAIKETMHLYPEKPREVSREVEM